MSCLATQLTHAPHSPLHYSLSFPCFVQLLGAGITWIYIPVYNQQLMGLSALNYITNGTLPTLTLGPGTYLAGASIGCYAVSLACTVYSKFHLRKAARMDKGRKYPLNAMLGSTETQHWCC